MSLPNLSALAVRERSVTLFFLLLSVVTGFYAFSSLGRAEDPAFTVRAMVVSVAWPGATPEVLQNQVVDRLEKQIQEVAYTDTCLLYTSPSPRDRQKSRMPSSA